MRTRSAPSGPSVRDAPFVPRPGAPSPPAAVGQAGSLRAPVLSPSLPARGRRPGLLPARARPVASPPRPQAARRRTPLPRRSAPLLCPPPLLLTVRLRRGGAALLLKTKLGDLRGAVELLREVLAAARANPDMGPAHENTKKYAGQLAKWEAQL
eukprot:COSAG01_NODE_4403_length_5060_cov_15.005644_8_plen_154_part_00